MSSLALQATIGGMSAAGQQGATTLLGGFDPGTGVLMIDKALTVPPGAPERRYGNSAALTNNAGCDDYDVLFEEDSIQDAIGDFFDFQGRGLLVLADEVMRFAPGNAIELDGIDEKGRKYRIGQGITNGQLAVIAMCWYALRQGSDELTIGAFDAYDDFAIHSVGLPGVGRSQASRSIMGGQVRLGFDGWPVENE